MNISHEVVEFDERQNIQDSAHFGAVDVAVMSSVGLHLRLLKYHPCQGNKKIKNAIPELPTQNVREPILFRLFCNFNDQFGIFQPGRRKCQIDLS